MGTVSIAPWPGRPRFFGDRGNELVAVLLASVEELQDRSWSRSAHDLTFDFHAVLLHIGVAYYGRHGMRPLPRRVKLFDLVLAPVLFAPLLQ
jgi:hypothetical protein